MALAATAMLIATVGHAGTRDPERWTASWATATMPGEAGSALPAAAGHDATLRQFVRITIGGKRVRLRLTNVFGTAPLELDSVRIALADRSRSGAIRPGTGHMVRFNGSDSVVIPAGAEYASDPIDLPVESLTVLAITFHYRDAPPHQTVHYVSKTTSYLAAGKSPDDLVLPNATPIEHWYQIAAIDVQPASATRAVAVLGDSITDGHGATADAHDRWTDRLAERLQADPNTRGTAVLNFGISGNRLLKDGAGPSGMARLSREVLSQPGLRTLVVFEGVNDVGKLSREGPVTSERREAVIKGVTDAYAQIIAYAHARGIRVVGATILPFGGTQFYRSDADADADRRRINAWIRTPGHFDAIIDFDAVVRDPADPSRLRAAYDSGDRLHPSPAGYRAMGQAVPLAILAD